MKGMSLLTRTCFAVLVLVLSASNTGAVEFEHQEDVVYGYRDGLALVMDVFTPVEANGAAIIRVMGGGMRSSPTWSHKSGKQAVAKHLLTAGYTLFAAAHCSRPKFTVEDILADMPRAVRFIRHNARRFGIDPLRIGITGESSGAQVALLAATAPPAPDPESRDPVDHESSEVQAVVAYFPGIDNLNFGRPNTTILEHFHSQNYMLDAVFDFRYWDKEAYRSERVTDPEALRDSFRRTSPLYSVSGATPPVLLFHGDEDELVPLQQSELMVARLREAGVAHELIVAKGQGHGWKTPLENEYSEILGWFGEHLLGGAR